MSHPCKMTEHRAKYVMQSWLQTGHCGNAVSFLNVSDCLRRWHAGGRAGRQLPARRQLQGGRGTGCTTLRPPRRRRGRGRAPRSPLSALSCCLALQPPCLPQLTRPGVVPHPYSFTTEALPVLHSTHVRLPVAALKFRMPSLASPLPPAATFPAGRPLLPCTPSM